VIVNGNFVDVMLMMVFGFWTELKSSSSNCENPDSPWNSSGRDIPPSVKTYFRFELNAWKQITHQIYSSADSSRIKILPAALRYTMLRQKLPQPSKETYVSSLAHCVILYRPQPDFAIEFIFLLIL
jgi:hypothetical protein